MLMWVCPNLHCPPRFGSSELMSAAVCPLSLGVIISCYVGVWCTWIGDAVEYTTRCSIALVSLVVGV